MIYQFDSRVRYSETDQNGELSLSSVINYFQDCSTFQSEEIGLGLARLREKKRAWLVSYWNIVIRRKPRLKDPVTVQTWAYDFKGFYGYRNFSLNDQEGNRLIMADSLWIYVDTQTGHPVRIDQEELERYGREQRLDLEKTSRKISLPEGLTEKERLHVPRHLLDTNGHVNNGKYIQLALDCLPENFRPSRIRAEYRKQARLGDQMILCTAAADGKTYTTALNDAKGSPYAIVEFQS